MQRICTESVKTSETFDKRQALVCHTAVFSVVTQRSPPPPPPPALRDDTKSGCVSDSTVVPKQVPGRLIEEVLYFYTTMET